MEKMYELSYIRQIYNDFTRGFVDAPSIVAPSHGYVDFLDYFNYRATNDSKLST